MSRKDEFKSKITNPSSKFLTWGSNNKCFSYYDKEKGENIKLALPIKFIVLKQLHTVKGWNNESQSGIFSNEVPLYNLGKDEVTVKSFKGGEIAKGIYSAIKVDIEKAGGHYSRSIYSLDENGKLININVKGSASSVWSTFFKENTDALLDNYVEVAGAKEERNGAIAYTTPIFKVGEEIGAEATEAADEAYQVLVKYLDAYLKVPTPDVDEIPLIEFETDEIND